MEQPPTPTDRKENDVEQTPNSSQSSNRTVMLVLSYFGPLALIPLLVEKEDAEIQWHARHGLVMTGAWIVLFVALGVLSAMAAVLPAIGWMLSALLSCGVYPLLSLAILVLHIVAMVKAVRGERMTLPFVTDFANR